jgi:hypothetical protein
MPNDREYRNEMIRTGGWIDQAERMEFTPEEAMPKHLRIEFFSLIGFLGHCLTLSESCSSWSKPSTLLRLLITKFRERKK